MYPRQFDMLHNGGHEGAGTVGNGIGFGFDGVLQEFVNQYGAIDLELPFGGFKQSGNGRDKSMHAFDDYTELKTTWIEFD